MLPCYFERESLERVPHQIADVAVIAVAAEKLRLIFPYQRVRRDQSDPDLKAVLIMRPPRKVRPFSFLKYCQSHLGELPRMVVCSPLA